MRSRRNLLVCLGLVLTMCFLAGGSQALAGSVSIWDTNYGTMYLTIQDDGTVTGYYHFDGGIITGTLEGNLIKGWWREVGNAKECGPDNAWSGPFAFRITKNWKSFVGDWDYCPDTPDDLNPSDASWVGDHVKGPAPTDLLGKWNYLTLNNGMNVDGVMQVVNIGSTAAKQFKVGLFLSPDGVEVTKPFKTFTIKNLGAGKSRIISFKHTFGADISGQSIVAIVDLRDKIPEEDEDNNRAVIQTVE